eukprot:CAMPEP_0119028362 /NCGR_PEP_ID=MMETSP1176-20130426/38732_1 /TAXON_ID=265551 /ORGANISM="Synedropsis recta cf, Strain CCMP1620" /LENGTH=262 /DNA_ID=CAMNT_0006984481 /DNA_START=314 /DNA_END=1102 /DNA_ORIENTATION=+
MAAPLIPEARGITTIVLEKGTKLGVQLVDVTIGTTKSSLQTFPAVKAVAADGIAASKQIQPGMILLGKYDTSKGVISRIQKGPYPIVLQFYDLGKVGDDYQDNPVSPQIALTAAQQASKEAAAVPEPQVSAKGTGLVTKTIQKPTTPCPNKETRARRGDLVEINFEARVASPGGPIYDSSGAERGNKPISFVLGSGESIKGVDAGLYDMCPGEIKTMDIPSGLAYGRSGSRVFDIPPDVRLWWRVELLKVTKSENPPLSALL